MGHSYPQIHGSAQRDPELSIQGSPQRLGQSYILIDVFLSQESEVILIVSVNGSKAWQVLHAAAII
jgi:hypothetical protein